MNDLLLHDSLDTSPVVFSDRILYTPTSFAKTALLYLQEIGSLQAKKPHTSSRTHLSSYLFFCVNSGSGELEYQRKKYKLGRGDCVFIDNPTKQMFAIQACGMDAEGANRVPKKNQDDRYEIKSKDLVRLIYQSCGWDRTRSYPVAGCRVSAAEARELRAVPRHSHLRGKDGQGERKHAGASAGGF